MLSYYNLNPSQALYVGDNPYKDFLGPKSLGIKTIRVLKGKYKHLKKNKFFEADKKINKLTDLKKFCEKKNILLMSCGKSDYFVKNLNKFLISDNINLDLYPIDSNKNSKFFKYSKKPFKCPKINSKKFESFFLNI